MVRDRRPREEEIESGVVAGVRTKIVRTSNSAAGGVEDPGERDLPADG